jgi:hypothetical protein
MSPLIEPSYPITVQGDKLFFPQQEGGGHFYAFINALVNQLLFQKFGRNVEKNSAKRNTRDVKFFAGLDLDAVDLFLDGHYL